MHRHRLKEGKANEIKKDLIHERDPTPEHHENPLTIQFDAYEFLHHLEECDLTEEQKIEYLQTVWSIVLQFVDLGFDFTRSSKPVDKIKIFH